MKTVFLLFGAGSIALAGAATGCSAAAEAPAEVAVEPRDSTDFERDVAFLRGYDPDLVVLSHGDVALAASARYQGKVFTSTTGRGESQGFINYDAFAVDPPAAHINAYGGEQRLWVGPEGGTQAIFFAPGADFTSEAWQTPAAIDHEPWVLRSTDARQVSFSKRATFQNRAGVGFETEIGRTVALLPDSALAAAFGDTIAGLRGVGYVTINALTNVGAKPWAPATGTISLWLLDILPAGDSVVAILPYRDATPRTLDTTNAGYFGPTPADRLRVAEGAVLFRGDGEEVGKVGLPVAHATGRLGSIDLERGVLTVIQYDYDRRARYQGMEWRELDDPYAGDAVTSYNNGAGPAKPSFYELESIAPAAFIAPGESAFHQHTVFHFTGERAALLDAAEGLLGVDRLELVEFLAR